MIVAGFGFNGSATEQSLADALLRVATDVAVDRFASAEDKVADPVFQGFCKEHGVKVVAVGPQLLERQSTHTQSSVSLELRKTGSVAEAAALAAAGEGARLIASRDKSADGCATCALAEGEGS